MNTKILNRKRFEYILCGVCFVGFFTLIPMLYMDGQIRKMEDCLMDVDARITDLEQSRCETDSAINKALQSANESTYLLRLMRK